MMRNFTNEDFDEFLKRNADEFRMRPSHKVWKNISGHLRERRRRFLFTTIGFVLITGMIGYFIQDTAEKITPASVAANTGSPNSPVQTSEPTVVRTSETETARRIDRVPGTKNSLSVAARNPQERNNRSTTATDGLNTVRGPLRVVKPENTNETVPAVVNQESEFVPQVADSDPEEANTIDDATADLMDAPVAEDPLTIESVVNSYKLISRNGKLAMQVFITPTVSYRKLSENKRFNAQPASTNGTNYPAIYSINDAVTHKPDMGLELGLTAKYAVDKNIKLRGGLQFNVSRYDIKAYTYTSELATIALGRGGSGSVNYIDEISSYRNFDGNKADWLQNMYFQVSAPLGIELKLSGNDRASFGIASTLQPSYMLGERAYMLSSDYKNYTKVPELVRRWNVATNLETFVSYSTGDVKWQVGPQVRYQLFSSFVSKYPVKEHLFDFGLKVGVSLNRKKTESDTK